MRASRLRERITLQRLDHASGTWVPFAANIAAAMEPRGEEIYNVPLRYRADLRSKADLEPAVRLVWPARGFTLRVEDVLEVEPRKEVHLLARLVTIETDNLAAGAKEITTWP